MNKILLVDDDEQYIHLVKNLLVEAHMKVICAHCAEEALVKLENERFSLMLTDLNMPPGMNGYSLALRAIAKIPDMPIVLSTGDISADIETQATEIGIKAVLPKPFSPQALVSMVKSILKEKVDTIE
jgi:DNA-binding NtrC family response regulator